MNTIKRLFISLVGISLLAGVFGGLQLVTPQAGTQKTDYVPKVAALFQPETAAAGDAKFRVPRGTGGPGGYSKYVKMCHNWGWADWYTTNWRICGGAFYLFRGQSSNGTYGYADTDGTYVPAYHNNYTSIINFGGPDFPWVGKYRTGYHKITGCGAGSCHRNIKRIFRV